MKAPYLNNTAWSWIAAILIVTVGIIAGIIEALVDFSPIIHVWEKYPYMIGNGIIVMTTIASVWWYCYQNSKKVLSHDYDYECGTDFFLSILYRVLMGLIICGLYIILVTATR